MSILKHLGCVVALFGLITGCSGGEEGSNVASDEAITSTGEALQLPILKACASSSQCPTGSHCTTEDGVCNRPPGCKPGDICPDLCYGVCSLHVIVPPPGGCGHCPPGMYCTQQVCPLAQ